MEGTVENLEQKESKSGTYHRLQVNGEWKSLWQESVSFSEGDKIEYTENGDDFIKVEDVISSSNQASEGRNSRAESISRQVALKAAVKNTEEGTRPEIVTEMAADFHHWLQEDDVDG